MSRNGDGSLRGLCIQGITHCRRLQARCHLMRCGSGIPIECVQYGGVGGSEPSELCLRCALIRFPGRHAVREEMTINWPVRACVPFPPDHIHCRSLDSSIAMTAPLCMSTPTPSERGEVGQRRRLGSILPLSSPPVPPTRKTEHMLRPRTRARNLEPIPTWCLSWTSFLSLSFLRFVADVSLAQPSSSTSERPVATENDWYHTHSSFAIKDDMLTFLAKLESCQFEPASVFLDTFLDTPSMTLTKNKICLRDRDGKLSLSITPQHLEQLGERSEVALNIASSPPCFLTRQTLK